MTITSIGYGDIVPVRSEEYIVSILCMIAGGVLWAYVVGSIVSIMSSKHPIDSEFEANMDLLNLAMTDMGVSKTACCRYRQYLREAKAHDANMYFTFLLQRFSPALRGTLLMQGPRKMIRNVYYLNHTPEPILMEMAEILEPKFFGQREPLHSIGNCLCIRSNI
eukprot:CAMPEP_0180642980 /NCGR_PEP_ID=MMETSP1037_2-20121125/47533_1 /TAXON_ID=632150 /ORGANISM="Azadinium spinosum, Strain 3D9" /LENGTH=163 /DNA_ID=CAMNT_0022666383 /DNA_START=97 /DNA_END=588 /DNA_ORIENTATION=-